MATGTFFHTLSSSIALCAIIAIISNHLFTSRDSLFSSLPSPFLFLSFSLLLCPTFPQLLLSFPCCTIIPWLLFFHEKGRSVLPVLLTVKALLGPHRVKYQRLWSAQPSPYRIPGTPPTNSSLRCPTAKPLPPLILGCFLASIDLPVPPRFQNQEKFRIYRLGEDLVR